MRPQMWKFTVNFKVTYTVNYYHFIASCGENVPPRVGKA